MRLMTADDCEAVARVHVVTWQEGYRGLIPQKFLDALDVAGRAERWGEILESGETSTFVIEREGVIVGFSNSGPSRDADLAAPEWGEIRAIYVDPKHWDGGYGRDLLDRSLLQLEQEGYTKSLVWVLEGNDRAIRFYEKAGYGFDGKSKDQDWRDGHVLKEKRMTRC